MPGLQGLVCEAEDEEEDRLPSDEIAALIERPKAGALKEGDGEIITAVIKSWLRSNGCTMRARSPSKPKLRAAMAIPRPKRHQEKKSDE